MGPFGVKVVKNVTILGESSGTAAIPAARVEGQPLRVRRAKVPRRTTNADIVLPYCQSFVNG